MAAVYRHRTSASDDATAGVFWVQLSSEPPPTLLPPGGRHCTCNSVQRKILANPAQAHPKKVGALQVDSTEENRHLGISDFPLHNKATFKKILFPRTKQNKTNSKGKGKTSLFYGLGGGFRFFFSWSFMVDFFFSCPRMERSEKNKINHLSIVFSGMSSVSLGWGVGTWGEGSGERPKPSPISTFRSFGFLLPADGRRAWWGQQRENTVMASPR